MIARLVNECEEQENSDGGFNTPVRKYKTKIHADSDTPTPGSLFLEVDDEYSMLAILFGTSEPSDGVDTSPDADTTVKDPVNHKPLSLVYKRASKREARVEKSLSKASKSQQRYQVAIRREEIDAVARAIHGDDYGHSNAGAHPLATDKTIEEVIARNIPFVSAVKDHQAILLKSSTQQQNLTSKNGIIQKLESEQADKTSNSGQITAEHVAAILIRLGINPRSPSLSIKSADTSSFNTPNNWEKTKASILHKLSLAIAEDLETHENEQEQTCVRAAGFWRYANQGVLSRMTRNAQLIDRATGAMIKDKDNRDGVSNAGLSVGNGNTSRAKPKKISSEDYNWAGTIQEGLLENEDCVNVKSDEDLVKEVHDTTGAVEGVYKDNLLDSEDAEQDKSRRWTAVRDTATAHPPVDVYSLSMLDYRSAEGIGEYFRRNGKFSDRPGRFVLSKKY